MNRPYPLETNRTFQYLPPQKVAQLLKDCQQNGCLPNGRRTCSICNREPDMDELVWFGVYIPDKKHQRRIGAPKNRTRFVIHVLCEVCHERPDIEEIVERKFFRLVGAQ